MRRPRQTRGILLHALLPITPCLQTWMIAGAFPFAALALRGRVIWTCLPPHYLVVPARQFKCSSVLNP